MESVIENPQSSLRQLENNVNYLNQLVREILKKLSSVYIKDILVKEHEMKENIASKLVCTKMPRKSSMSV